MTSLFVRYQEHLCTLPHCTTHRASIPRTWYKVQAFAPGQTEMVQGKDISRAILIAAANRDIKEKA